MKKTTKKSPMMKIVSAAAMLAVSASMLGTSTYAWFTMNKSVTVSGMTVHTVVNSNLQIAETNSEAAFSAVPLSQSVTALLEPASTIDGVDFFYHAMDSNILGSGNSTDHTYTAYSEAADLANTAAKKDKYSAGFQSNYGIATPITTANVAYGYVDYTFYLKATNTSGSATSVYLTKCNLLHDGAAVTDKAWRAAMFVEEVAEGASGSAAAATNLVTILGLNGAAYFTDGNAVAEASGADALDDVTNFGADAVVDASLANETTQRYKVIIRVWLEGESVTCNNETYASLANDPYTLDLKFELDQGTAVDEIGSSTT